MRDSLVKSLTNMTRNGSLSWTRELGSVWSTYYDMEIIRVNTNQDLIERIHYEATGGPDREVREALFYNPSEIEPLLKLLDDKYPSVAVHEQKLPDLREVVRLLVEKTRNGDLRWYDADGVWVAAHGYCNFTVYSYSTNLEIRYTHPNHPILATVGSGAEIKPLINILEEKFPQENILDLLRITKTELQNK